MRPVGWQIASPSWASTRKSTRKNSHANVSTPFWLPHIRREFPRRNFLMTSEMSAHYVRRTGHKIARKSLRNKFSCKIIDNVAKHHNRCNSSLRVGFWLWAFKTPQPNLPLAFGALWQEGLHFSPLMFSRKVFPNFCESGTRDVICFVITGAKTRKIHHLLGLFEKRICQFVRSKTFYFRRLVSYVTGSSHFKWQRKIENMLKSVAVAKHMWKRGDTGVRMPATLLIQDVE